ncbi:DUF4012 domain-containing protein [Paenarthrobacter sp. NPDC089316]|uniref:DUF4012 domain-containing protein n=1 Tax=Paenarthrobacter sp. NPDC089316 TaxID=3154974 RepID=UPI00344395D5
MSATSLVKTLKSQIAAKDAAGAAETVDDLVQHTTSAREAANDPLWKATSVIPWVGPNLVAASEIATSADDVARLGAVPLVNAFESLDWHTLRPTPDGIDLKPLTSAAPQVQAASHAVRETSKRLAAIDSTALVPQVSGPLLQAQVELSSISGQLDTAADAAVLAPSMLGADVPRTYLLLMQNSAESRSTGGIPGALAVLRVDHGKISLESQTSAGALGSFAPPIPTDSEEAAIYSGRIGKFMQDVNLTPDFATTGSVAVSMWETRTGEKLDGALSLDPVALSYLLKATGPVQITDPTLARAGRGLPSELNSGNVVKTLLSDTYASIKDPKLQDAYFAGAAKEIFSAFSAGNSNAEALMDAVSQGVAERRILIWSKMEPEQKILGKYPLAGLVSGPSVSPTQFGIYFNDGTGAKMDYWVKRTVKVVRDCTKDGYREVSIRVTSTNTAPSDAAKSLPDYVTGGGAYGVPPGSVQTNVVAYGPSQSNIDTVVKDGKKIAFAAQRHEQRAVGTSTILLGPGESTSLDFNFGHIVQHSDPKIVVTPTTQAVKDVLQDATPSPCE